MEPAPLPQRRLFSRQPAEPAMPPAGFSELEKRLRSLEQRLATLQRQLQVNEQNMLAGERVARKDSSAFRGELVDVRGDIDHLKELLAVVAREVRRAAPQEEVQVLKKYLDLWEPVKFVTQEQVEKIVAELLEEKRKP